MADLKLSSLSSIPLLSSSDLLYVVDDSESTSNKTTLGNLATFVGNNLVTTPGTAEASKALVLDANKDFAGVRNASFEKIDTTGLVTISPSGNIPIKLSMKNAAGDTANNYAFELLNESNQRIFSVSGVGRVDTYGAGAATISWAGRVIGDSTGRIFIRSDGRYEVGDGTGMDLRLQRTAPKTWTIDDASGGNATLNVIGSLVAGTGKFTGNVSLENSSPVFRLAPSGSTTTYAEIWDSGTALHYDKYRQSGEAGVYITPRPSDGTSSAHFRIFRATNTTGYSYFDICRANGNNDINTRLGANGLSYLNALVGNVGVGTNSPSAKFHVVGTSRFDGAIVLPPGSSVAPSICVGDSTVGLYNLDSSLGLIANGQEMWRVGGGGGLACINGSRVLSGNSGYTFINDNDTSFLRESENTPAVVAGGTTIQRWTTAGTEIMGHLRLGSMADSSAPNNSIYYSTTQSKLVYKDSSGNVHELY